jgi:hypothetical protein
MKDEMVRISDKDDRNTNWVQQFDYKTVSEETNRETYI